MRIALLVVGTRGDIVPATAFARALAARGHDPRIASSEDHRAHVEAAGLAFAPLSPSYAEAIAGGDPRLGRSERAGASLVRDRMIEAAAGWRAQGLAAVEGAGLILGFATPMGAVADALGERCGIPVAHAHLMPLTPTRHVPPPLPPPGRRILPGPANLALFRAMRLLVWRACFAEAVARLRASLGLPALPWSGRRPPKPTLCAWSPSLLPAPPDWDPARLAVVGDWHTGPDGAAAFAPDARLAAFLAGTDASGRRPVHVGFGSMSVAAGRRAPIADAIGAGIARAGVRALLGGVLLDGERSASEPSADVMRPGPVPYRWLFPLVSVAVHHGGAGGTHDAARAGVPQVVVPFAVDQWLWARRLQALGVAPGRLDRRRLDAASVARAIDAALAPPVRRAATRLAERIGAEDGCAAAVATLERWRLLG